ncbi:hypothetical protein TYRP_001090 [Tyrophagus putrescentiae]|nr:hypothetical protein TYRP_001090 [Tyrophagus putrescentiae]
MKNQDKSKQTSAGSGTSSVVSLGGRIPITQADALQDVGDVVDAALLHLQNVRGVIEVDGALGGALQQVDELARQLTQRGLISADVLLSSSSRSGGRRGGRTVSAESVRR